MVIIYDHYIQNRLSVARSRVGLCKESMITNCVSKGGPARRVGGRSPEGHEEEIYKREEIYK